MRKYDIIIQMAAKLALKALLEVSTPVTGATFDRGIESGSFDRCDRLVYRCPPGFDDGSPITFRTSSDRADELLLNLHAAFGQAVYDIIFVDSWHTLACSSLDLFAAWAMLRPGGVLVVHDCNPPRFELAHPEPPDPYGEWVGVTYQAFVEFLFCGLHSRAFTVDADYGVGVVFKGDGAPSEAGEGSHAHHRLPWHLLRETSAAGSTTSIVIART